MENMREKLKDMAYDQKVSEKEITGTMQKEGKKERKEMVEENFSALETKTDHQI